MQRPLLFLRKIFYNVQNLILETSLKMFKF